VCIQHRSDGAGECIIHNSKCKIEVSLRDGLDFCGCAAIFRPPTYLPQRGRLWALNLSPTVGWLAFKPPQGALHFLRRSRPLPSRLTPCHLKVNCPEGARETTLGCPQRGRLCGHPGRGVPTGNSSSSPSPEGKTFYVLMAPGWERTG